MTTTTEHGPLTVSDLVALSTLLEATKVRRVRWLNEHGDLLDGVARCFAHEGGGFLGKDDDVRDYYLHVSGTFEHWLPVRELIPMVNEGRFVLDGEA